MWQFVLILAVIYFFFRWKGAEALLQAKNKPHINFDKTKNSKQKTSGKDNNEDYIDYEEID